MSRRRVQLMSYKQRITPDLKINNSTPLSPPTHAKEDLTVIQGSSYQTNAKQLMVTKTDENNYPTEVKATTSTFTEREVLPPPETIIEPDVRDLILQTFASILLNQDKALIANLISKRTIIVPINDLCEIVHVMTNGDVEIRVDEDCTCCATKVSPIKKIEAIKIIKDDVVITDFKQVFNKEYNELVNNYHVNLKYVVD